ncbi:hypothetical protein DITRI_Ditri18aG0013500 [Diplodiscus trichospermus]
MKVALTKLSKAAQNFSKNGVFNGESTDKMSIATMDDYGELLSLAIDHVNISLSSSDEASVIQADIESSDHLKKKADIIVAKDGSRNYKSISVAFEAKPEKSKKRTVIYVKKGVYKENVKVEKSKWNVTMIGDGRESTICKLAYEAVFRKAFVARDMGFVNTSRPQKHQANCKIFPRQPLPNQQNTVTAQGKVDPNQNIGISIQNCTILLYENISSSVQTYLGRPWKDYSTTIYMSSNIGSSMDLRRWLPWSGNAAPNTIFYYEYKNIGAGSSTNNRVKWKGIRTEKNLLAKNRELRIKFMKLMEEVKKLEIVQTVALALPFVLALAVLVFG